MDSLRDIKLSVIQLKRVVEMFTEEVYRDLSVSMECSEEELMEMWADVYDKKCEFKVGVRIS